MQHASVRLRQKSVQSTSNDLAVDALAERVAALTVQPTTGRQLSWTAEFAKALADIKPFHANADGLESKKPAGGWDQIGGCVFPFPKAPAVRLARF